MSNLEFEALYFKDSLPFLGKDIALRVEGEDDIVFWTNVFKEALPEKEVEVFHFSNSYPSSSASGKNTILPLREFADEKLCICIDSDYDYVLGIDINIGNSFVFQTYLYSIESFWGFAPRLNQVLEKTTNTQKQVEIDFESIFKKYSELIFEGFIMSIAAEQNYESSFERHIFAKTATSEVFDLRSLDEVINKISQNLTNHIIRLQALYTWDLEGIKETLLRKGIDNANAYLFIRGHDLFNKPILQLVKQAHKIIVNEKYKEIRNSTSINQQKTKFEEYRDNQINIKDALKGHYGFQNSTFYQMIINDIKNTFY